MGVEQTERRSRDGGFTLVELLIVIVILGILATVSVFAVRGITDEGQASACATDFRQIHTAQELNLALHGAYGSEADLVANGSLTSESVLFDTTAAGDGYSVTASDPSCTQSAAIGGAGGTPTAAVAGSQSAPTSITFHGIGGAQEYGGSGNDELLIFGRGEAAADWATATSVGMDVTRRVTFMNIDAVGDYSSLINAVSQANNNPPTSYAVYVDDDTSTFDGYPSFQDALNAVIATDATFAGPVHQLDADDVQNMAWVFLQYQ